MPRDRRVDALSVVTTDSEREWSRAVELWERVRELDPPFEAGADSDARLARAVALLGLLQSLVAESQREPRSSLTWTARDVWAARTMLDVYDRAVRHLRAVTTEARQLLERSENLMHETRDARRARRRAADREK